jgi:hypothetical protein
LNSPVLNVRRNCQEWSIAAQRTTFQWEPSETKHNHRSPWWWTASIRRMGW